MRVLRRLSMSVAVAGAVLGAAAPASAAQRTLFPSQDNTLIQDAAGSLSNGRGPDLFVGMTHASSIRRALVQFDVAGVVPAGAHIDSVWLVMTLTRTIDPDPRPVALHRVQASWGEGTSNSGGGQLGGGGGAPATLGDATWLHRSFDTQHWTAPGGDYAAAASGQAAIGNATTLGEHFTWGSSAGMVADVQAWLDTPAANFGWLLKGDEAAALGVPTARRFASREAEAEANRPRLVVVFSGVGVESRAWSRVKALFR